MQSSNEILALFTDTCGGVEKQRPSHRGQGTYKTQQYQSFKVRDDIHIGISRGDYDPDEVDALRDKDGELDYSRLSELKYTRITELHVLNGDGEWAGGSVSIYKPEVDWRYRSHTDEEPFTIKPAYVSASSSSLETTDHARVQAEMLVLAANYADALTEEMRPELEAEAQRLNVEHKQDRENARIKQAERQSQFDDLLQQIDGVWARVRAPQIRKSSFRGPVTKAESGFQIMVGPHKVPVSKIESIEVRNHSGRYIAVDFEFTQ